MDNLGQVRQAIAFVQTPTEYNEWFGWLPRMKAVGMTPEEAEEWSREGGVKEKWVRNIPAKWAGLPNDDPGIAAAVIFKKAREAGWQGAPQRGRPGRRVATPPDLARAGHAPRVYHGKVRTCDYTVSDLLEEPIWFVQSEKMPYQHRVDGGWAGYKQSLQDNRGGVATARYGGETTWTDPDGTVQRFLVYPHRTYHQIAALIPKLPNPRGLKLRPSISMSGDARYPHPTDLVVVDFDYKPCKDPEGRGEQFRNRARAAMTACGAPVFTSSSGNGFHAVFRMVPGWVHSNRRRGTETRLPKDRNTTNSGAVAEIFPAGYRKHVVLRLERPLANHQADRVVPYISETALWRMLTAAATPQETAPRQRRQVPSPQVQETQPREETPTPER